MKSLSLYQEIGLQFDLGRYCDQLQLFLVRPTTYVFFSACNSLLVGISQKLQKKLQNVQRTSARLIFKKRKFDSITAELINELHWLPIKQRIDYKILALVYKALHGQAPSDVTDMLQITTRSSSDHLARMVLLLSSQGLGVLLLVTEPFLPMHLDCGTDCLVTSKIVLLNSSRNS